MKEKIFVIAIILFVTDLTECHQKVLLENVKTLTLKKDQMTSGRRNSPVPQIKCVGGSAKGKFIPKVVQCTQTGHDGLDYQWRCTADLPQELEFGEVTVNCEGYTHPEDPYILAGSCGLEYNLEYRAENYAEKDYKERKSRNATSILENVVPWIVVVFILFVLYQTLFSSNNSETHQGRGGNGFDHGPGYPPNDPRGPPPGYDDIFGKKTNSNCNSANQAADGPGFWTGAGLGALGGYMFGRQQGTSAPRRQSSPVSDHYASDSFGTSTSSSEMQSSTGYGGTRRR